MCNPGVGKIVARKDTFETIGKIQKWTVCYVIALYQCEIL